MAAPHARQPLFAPRQRAGPSFVPRSLRDLAQSGRAGILRRSARDGVRCRSGPGARRRECRHRPAPVERSATDLVSRRPRRPGYRLDIDRHRNRQILDQPGFRSHSRRRLFRRARSRAQAAGGKNRRNETGRFRPLRAAEKKSRRTQNLRSGNAFFNQWRNGVRKNATVPEKDRSATGSGLFRVTSDRPHLIPHPPNFDRSPAPRRGRLSAIGTGTMTPAPEALVPPRGSGGAGGAAARPTQKERGP